MRSLVSLSTSVLATILFLTPIRTALAASIVVANPSFETLPSGGLPIACGGACAYSIGPIPGWNDSGLSGQWITGGVNGNPNAIDGSVLAFTDNSVIWQDVGTAVAGATYTLHVDVLHRTDALMLAEVQLEIGATSVSAAAVDNGPGTWSDWTAVYTATAADAGGTITILLSASNNQGDFDNVRLDGVSGASSVPEPGTLMLLGTGLLLAGRFNRRLWR